MREPSSIPQGMWPPAVWLRVDAACDRFEAAWRSGSRPDLREFVAVADEPERGLLMGELLVVELAYRRRRGEQPLPDEYAVRFPGSAAAVREAFSRFQEADQGERAPHGPGAGSPEKTVVAPPEERAAADTLVDFDPAAEGRVGGYDLLEEIGRGGMGVVYRALQRSTGRIVAVKLIHPEQLASLTPMKRQRWLQRFRREARLTAQIEHENVVVLFDVEEVKGQPFFSMRYINGRPLAEMLNEGPLPAHRAAAYLEPIARAVQRAHDRGILHRDIKPRNILIGAEGRPYLTDFGLACWNDEVNALPVAESVAAQEPDGDLTPGGACIGTPPYMSPEQVRDASQIGPAADIYSLGATLYEMLTGKPPFLGKDHPETFRQILQQQPIPPRRHDATIPLDLETIALTCLQKDPTHRYRSAGELADDLQRYLEDKPTKVRPLGQAERLGRWFKRKPSQAVAYAAAALVAVLMVVGVVHHRENDWKNRQRRTYEALDLGLSHCERGEVALGLNWLTRSLELAPSDDHDLQRVIRRNLTAWAPQLGGIPLVQVRHPAQVVTTAFSPDGITFLTGDVNGGVRLWNARTGELIREYRGHEDSIRAVAFSPGGGRCVSAGWDKTARVWEVATGKELVSLKHEAHALLALFAKSESHVLTGGSDGQVTLWDLVTGERLKQIQTGTSLFDMVLSPDGKALLTRSMRKAPVLWDISSGTEICRFEPGEEVAAMAFLPNGQSVLTLSSTRETSYLRTWNLNEKSRPGQRIFLAPAPGPRSLAISPDGTLALAGIGSGVFLCDLAAASVTEIKQPWNGSIRDVSLQSSQAAVLTFSDGLTSWVVGIPLTDKHAATLPHSHTVWSLAATQDGKTVATSIYVPIGTLPGQKTPGGGVQFWDPMTCKPLGEPIPSKEWVLSLAFSPDGKTLAAGGRDKHVELRQVPTGELRARLAHDTWVAKVEFSPDGRMLLSLGIENTAYVWDVASGQELFQLPHADVVKAAAFSPDSSRIVTGCRDGSAYLWDAAAGTLVARLPHGNEVHWAAFHPNGQTFLTAGPDGIVHIWDTTRATRLHSCVGHGGAIRCVAYSPDGKRLVTGSADGTIRIWGATKGEPLGTPLIHASRICSITPSPDGALLLVGCEGGFARLWDVATGKPIGPPLKHAGAVRASVFVDGGSGFLTTGNGKNPYLRRVPDPLAQDSNRIRLWSQVLTRMELDPSGVSRSLDETTWNNRRQELEAAGDFPL